MFPSAQFCTLLSTFLWQFKYVQASLILKYIKEKPLNHNSIWNYCPVSFLHSKPVQESQHFTFCPFSHFLHQLWLNIWLMPHHSIKMGIITSTSLSNNHFYILTLPDLADSKHLISPPSWNTESLASILSLSYHFNFSFPLLALPLVSDCHMQDFLKLQM